MMITKTSGALTYLQAETISVPHCFTTRLGGVSTGALSSMNIGIHRGDDPDNVLKNYAILGKELGFSPEDLVLTRQTHSDIVKVVGLSERGAGLFAPEMPECDALVTCTPGVGLVVFTADCTPILLFDPVTGAVGAAHAGWRGTASRIAAKAVRAMTDAFGCCPEDIRAAIGPNIGPCCFETHEDVPQAMLASLGDAANAHIRKSGEKYYVNLKWLNALILRQAGVRSIAVSDHCTVCNPTLYWSHRVVGSNRGSQGAIIICKEVAP